MNPHYSYNTKFVVLMIYNDIVDGNSIYSRQMSAASIASEAATAANAAIYARQQQHQQHQQQVIYY